MPSTHGSWRCPFTRSELSPLGRGTASQSNRPYRPAQHIATISNRRRNLTTTTPSVQHRQPIRTLSPCAISSTLYASTLSLPHSPCTYQSVSTWKSNRCGCRCLECCQNVYVPYPYLQRLTSPSAGFGTHCRTPAIT